MHQYHENPEAFPLQKCTLLIRYYLRDSNDEWSHQSFFKLQIAYCHKAPLEILKMPIEKVLIDQATAFTTTFLSVS